jgi:ribosomal-protein-alanine N-acetyltransferase
MNVEDLDSIAGNLQDDYDDFWSYSILKSELENEDSKYIVAKCDEEIVGFAGIWIAIDEAHITNIVTKKKYRHIGIGSVLLKKLIDLSVSLDMRLITLEVNENNLPAIKLYEKFDFKNQGFRKNYYNNCDSAIIMTKFFKEM